MALFRNSGLLVLKRAQSVPAVCYHKNVSNWNKKHVQIEYTRERWLDNISYFKQFQVLDHYENPRNAGAFDKKDQNVGTGLVGAPACGDVMKLQIRVDDNGKIIDAKFKTFGCVSAIASSSLATEWVKGKSLEEAGTLKNTDIAKELSLPPVKLHCSSKWWFCCEIVFRLWCHGWGEGRGRD